MLRLMLLIPLLRQFLLLDTAAPEDGREPYARVADASLIDLIDQVRYAMYYGLIPVGPRTPEHMRFTIPMLFKRGVAIVIRRRTLGHWVNFTVDEQGRWKPGWSARYHMSMDGEFAVSFIDPEGRESPLETRSVMQVLREERLWTDGLSSLLRQAN